MTKKCEDCGTLNDEHSELCEKCGTSLNSNKSISPESESMSMLTIILIVLGFIFSIFFALIGLIMSIYLLIRGPDRVKIFGIIMLIISLINMIAGAYLGVIGII